MPGYGKSAAGKIRKINEDAILVENLPVGRLPNLFVVADGMGGHLAGEVASKMAIDGLKDYMMKTEENSSIDAVLQSAVKEVNSEIYRSSSQNDERRGMGTTLLAATIEGGIAHIINIGDSRFYVIKKKENSIEQITVDHSFVMELLLKGKITAKEAEDHPNKNVITRAIGTSARVKCDIFTYTLNEEDILLLCTDGLSNMVPNDDILKICLTEDTIESICEKLLKEAYDKGGVDNISVILYSENGGEKY